LGVGLVSIGTVANPVAAQDLRRAVFGAAAVANLHRAEDQSFGTELNVGGGLGIEWKRLPNLFVGGDVTRESRHASRSDRRTVSVVGAYGSQLALTAHPSSEPDVIDNVREVRISGRRSSWSALIGPA
jgi:hypothetical protein